jgi:hypothetical protein
MFMIKDKKMLEKKCLPHYFASHKCAWFARQLNMYGFEKVSSRELLMASGVHDLQKSSHIVVYHHKFFQRGKQEALKHIVPSRRKSTNQQSTAAAAAAGVAPAAAAARKDTEGTTGLHGVDDDNLKSELQIMKNDLKLIEERVSSLEELLDQTAEVFASQTNELRQGAANFRPDLAGNNVDDHWSGRALETQHAKLAPHPAYGNAKKGGIDTTSFGRGLFERNLGKGECELLL